MVATRRAKAEATARAFTTLDVEMLSGIASFGGRRELWGLAVILKSPTGRELMPKDATFLASRDRVVLRKCVPRFRSHRGAKRSAPPEVPVEELTIRESDCLPYEYEGPPMATMGGGGGCVVA